MTLLDEQRVLKSLGLSEGEPAECRHVFDDYSFKCRKCGADEPESNVARLVPTQSESERAAEFKTRAAAALAPFLALMDEAAAAGFLVRWAALAPNAFGRHEVVDLHLIKRF